MSSGLALAIIASVLASVFAVLAVIRMRRTFEEPAASTPSLGSRADAEDGTRPTLVPERTAKKEAPPPASRAEPKPSKPATPRKAYVASQEDEDDVPTTLYRKDDDPDVEALLAEFDSEDAKR